jgi:hypothetical protein
MVGALVGVECFAAHWWIISWSWGVTPTPLDHYSKVYFLSPHGLL